MPDCNKIRPAFVIREEERPGSVVPSKHSMQTRVERHYD